MKILKQLKDLLLSTDMNFDEVRAFTFGIAKMPIEHQVAMYRIFSDDISLIYPTYINYKAKLAMIEQGIDWRTAVESEIRFLESYADGKRVGDEVKV